MPPKPNPAAFRRALAERVTDELATDLPRVSAHLGRAYADADDPDARALREHGGGFEWVAFGFDPHSMWDAHVGVLTDGGEVVVGLHVHERLSAEQPAAVGTLAEEVGASYRYSEAASEHQFNRPPVALDAVDADALAGEVAELCRRFEPLVDDLQGSRDSL